VQFLVEAGLSMMYEPPLCARVPGIAAFDLKLYENAVKCGARHWTLRLSKPHLVARSLPFACILLKKGLKQA